MSKKKPIQVTIQETKSKNPWVYVVDYGGNTIPQPGKDRYASAWSAKRGCCRAEGIVKGIDCWFIPYTNGSKRQVVFTTKRRK